MEAGRIHIKFIIRVLAVYILLTGSPAVVWPQQVIHDQEDGILRLTPEPEDTGSIRDLIVLGTRIQATFPDSALSIFRYTLSQSRKTLYYHGIVASLFRLGNLYAKKGLYEKGIQLLAEAIPYCYYLDRQHMYMAIAYSDIGILYQNMGRYEQASRLYYYAMWLTEQFPPGTTRSQVCNNFATMLIDLKRFNQALPYLNKAEEIARQQQNHEVLGSILINKGLCYHHQKKWDTSRIYFQEGLHIGRKYGLPVLEIAALTNLGELYLAMDKPGQALGFLLESRSLGKAINPLYTGASTALLGEVYYRLHRYEEAEHFLLSAMNRARELKLANDLIATNKTLAALYAAKKQYPQAYKHMQAYTELKDSISGREITNNVNQLEIKYRTANKDKEIIRKQLLIARQEKKLEKKNIWIGGAISGSVLLVIIFTGVYHNYRQRQKLQTRQIRILQQEQDILQQKQELLLKAQEIGQLKAMMNGEEKERLRIARELHDGIGGMLATVKMYLSTMKKDYPALSPAAHFNKAIHMLEDTSEEVRKTAHNLMPDILIRHNLQKALETYCESINATGQLHIDIRFYNLSEPITKAVELMLYRIIQELVQNIIKHAQATRGEIQVVEHEGILSIMVEDNGIGFDTEEEHNGFGLQNLRFRVQVLQGYLSITSVKGKSTTIHIEFNLENLKLAGIGYHPLNRVQS